MLLFVARSAKNFKVSHALFADSLVGQVMYIQFTAALAPFALEADLLQFL